MSMNDDTRVFGYKHWTLEEIPRCFYVGKGVGGRPYSNERNKKWHKIVSIFGLRVEICIGPITNEEAISWEIENIDKEKTYTKQYYYSSDGNSDIGCNFTTGGEGSLGFIFTEEQRLHMREAKLGKKLSDEHRLAMSIAQKVAQNTPEAKAIRKKINANPEVKKKRSDAVRKAAQNPITKEKRKKTWEIGSIARERLAATNASPEIHEKRSKISKEIMSRPETLERICRSVQQINVNTGEVIATFSSVKEASKLTGVNAGNLIQCCRGKKYKTVGGYKWRYFENPVQLDVDHVILDTSTANIAIQQGN